MPNSSPTTSELTRRGFLGSSARNAAGVAAGVWSLGATARAGANGALSIGVIGMGTQGRELARHLAGFADIRIVGICDVDARALAVSQHELNDLTGSRPVAVSRHEQLLERDGLDAVVIATPDHWHRALVEDACNAGKDIYLEQPVAHSIADGEAIRQAVERSGRIVQTGLPQRSGAHFASAVKLLAQGTIGQVHLAKAWAVHRRRSIGHSPPGAVPQGVDYQRWLGPAPAVEFHANRFHHHWPWFWDYGSGELGLWGVQLLDVVRWGLNLDQPTRVVATGGQRHFQDDRETPDTLTVQFAFPQVDVVWEHRQWSNRGIEGRTAGVAFYGDHGTLVVDRSGWKVYDGPDGLFAEASEIHSQHLRNWIDCVRTRTAPIAEMAIGQPSATLCHLGNIAYRLGREIHWNPQTGGFEADDEANRLLASV